MPNALYTRVFEKELFMLKKLLILTICVLGLTTLLGFLPIHGETALYENVLRLHVLANSDSEEDQALKLKVRDAVLEYTEEIFKNCTDKDEAHSLLEENLDAIKAVAEKTVAEESYSLPVSVALGEEEYPTKNYESCCFPSGEYTSLRIMLGNAEGQNWWCVLFPPLCLSAASNGADAFTQAGLTDDQYNIITQTDTPKYKVRFKILEAFEGVGKS